MWGPVDNSLSSRSAIWLWFERGPLVVAVICFGLPGAVWVLLPFDSPGVSCWFLWAPQLVP